MYIAGAGPVGLAAATSAFLLGAAVVVVGDINKDRLEQARSFGCETIDVTNGEPKDQLAHILGGEPEVDCGVDCVGFEAHGHGADAGTEAPATVLNSLMEATRAGGALGVPGLYVTGDPGAKTEEARAGFAVDPARSGLGEVALVRDRTMPRHALPPAADVGDPEWPSARSRATSTPR